MEGAIKIMSSKELILSLFMLIVLSVTVKGQNYGSWSFEPSEDSTGWNFKCDSIGQRWNQDLTTGHNNSQSSYKCDLGNRGQGGALQMQIGSICRTSPPNATIGFYYKMETNPSRSYILSLIVGNDEPIPLPDSESWNYYTYQIHSDSNKEIKWEFKPKTGARSRNGTAWLDDVSITAPCGADLQECSIKKPERVCNGSNNTAELNCDIKNASFLWNVTKGGRIIGENNKSPLRWIANKGPMATIDVRVSTPCESKYLEANVTIDDSCSYLSPKSNDLLYITSSNKTYYLEAGTRYYPINIGPDVKNLVLRSVARNSTEINNLSNYNIKVFNSSNITIYGIKLEGGVNSILIQNCTGFNISDNTILDFNELGINISNSTSKSRNYNYILNNHISSNFNNTNGILLERSNKTLLKDNSIYVKWKNTTGVCIELNKSSNCKLYIDNLTKNMVFELDNVQCRKNENNYSCIEKNNKTIITEENNCILLVGNMECRKNENKYQCYKRGIPINLTKAGYDWISPLEPECSE